MIMVYKKFTTTLLSLLIVALVGFPAQLIAQGGGLALPPGYDDSADEARYRKALEYYIRGVTAARAEQPREALRLFDRALRFDPSSAEIRLSLVETLVTLGDYDRARQEALLVYPLDSRALRIISNLYARAHMLDSTAYYLHLLVETDTTDFEALRGLGELYQRTGQVDSALLYFERYAERTGDFRTFASIGAARYERQDLQGALEAFQRSVELNSSSENITSISGLADVQGLMGKRTEQRETLQSLLELDSTYVATHRRLMEYYSRQGHFDSALTHASKEVDLLGQIPAAIRRLGILAYNADSLALAEEQFNTLLAIGDRDMSNYFFLGRIFQERGNYRYAIMNYRTAIQTADTLADGWLGLASTYLAMDSTQEAIDAYSDGLNRVTDPADILRLYFSLGAAYEQEGDFASSEQAFLGALAVDSMHAPSLNYLGYMLTERNERIAYAKELIGRALMVSPGNGAYIDSYAWALYQEGDYQGALDSLLRALESIPNDPAVFDHLGDTYDKLGQQDSARSYWRRALEIDTANTVIRNKLEQ